MYDEFKSLYIQTIQPETSKLKFKINSSEKKLTTLTFTLLIILIGIFLLTQHFDVHIIFFGMALFIATMVFYVGSHVFRYEYQEVLEATIFPKILKNINEHAEFIKYTELNTDAKKSGFFNLYNFFVASMSIHQKWAFHISISNKKTKIASTYLDYSTIENPALPFSLHQMKHGLFIAIEAIPWGEKIYIFEKNILPSYEQIKKSLKQGFETKTTYSDSHTVVSKPLNTYAEEKVVKLLSHIGSNTSLALLDNQMFLFISKEFRCFDADNYTGGSIPNDYNYEELLNILKTIKELINEMDTI